MKGLRFTIGRLTIYSETLRQKTKEKRHRDVRTYRHEDVKGMILFHESSFSLMNN